MASRSITIDRKGSGSGSKDQTRQGQSRQNSAPPFAKHGSPASGSSSKPKGPWKKGGTPRKSAKIADLSEQEMAQLRAEGKCFKCKEVGHLSRNCPQRTMMPGNGSNKPPGIPSFSMEMDVVENIDTRNILESMPVGKISMDKEIAIVNPRPFDPEWRKWYPTWMNPRSLALMRRDFAWLR